MSKKYNWTCDWCGKEYEITSSQLTRLTSGKQKSAFCSIHCKSESQMRKVVRHCACCGNEVIRTEYQSNKNENVFCSKDCKAKFLYKSTRGHKICAICGKVFETKKISSQRFCCADCANEYQKTRVGRFNAKYRREEVLCDYCHKPFDIRRYKLQDGKNHFCSQLCRRTWFAMDLSQDEDFKQNLRDNILGRLKNKKYIEVDSKPQLIVNSLLDNLSVEYEREYNAKYYAIDNYLSKSNLMIEVQGDYYHASPIKYGDKARLNQMQIKRVAKDKAKHSYIKNCYGIEILYLWEYDIIHRPDLCEKLIEEYVNNNGVLTNYNSFNYYLTDNGLSLFDFTVKSFQEE